MSCDILVSVLMPAYNAEKYIEDAINSVLIQEYDEFELLICDDGSTDSTFDYVNSIKDSRVRLIENIDNLGYLKTFNKLLTFAKGTFITFLDADDMMTKDRLSKQADYLLNNKKVGLVGTNYGRITEKGKIYSESNLPITYDSILNSFNKGLDFPFCGSSVMLRRELIDEVGGYREYFIGCPGEDIDWLRRISEKFEVSNIPDVCYLYRYSDNSLTRRPKHEIKARHIEDIIGFLAKQRLLNNGLDDLMTGGSNLNKYEMELKSKFDENPSLLPRKLGIEYAIQKDWSSSLKYSIIALSKNKDHWFCLVSFMLSLIILIFPTSFLLRLKSYFRINHVADKI